MDIRTVALAGVAALGVAGAASAADCASCTCKTKVVHRVVHRHPLVHRAVLAGEPPAVAVGVDHPRVIEREVIRTEPARWYGYYAPYAYYGPGPYYAYGYPYAYGPWGYGRWGYGGWGRGGWGYGGRWGYHGYGGYRGGFHHR